MATQRKPKQRRRGRRPYCTAAEFRRLKQIKANEAQRRLPLLDDSPMPQADRPEPAAADGEFRNEA